MVKGITSVADSKIPKLPVEGQQFANFIPKNWKVLDKVAFDFNGDRLLDYVGVLEEEKEPKVGEALPRILFTIIGKGPLGFVLDFQDTSLIRTRDEGGIFGDPYLPLTAEGNSFTTHSYGGSAWRWAEAYTYTYEEGSWYLTASDYTYAYEGGSWYSTASDIVIEYGPYITEERSNDYKKGVGIRNKRSSDFIFMEEVRDAESYDLFYEVALDPPLTLSQASFRFGFSLYRNPAWIVNSIAVENGVVLDKKIVQPPQRSVNYQYEDETYLLYTFTAGADETYLALYEKAEGALRIVAEDIALDHAIIYRDYIYFIAKEKKQVSYLDSQGSQKQLEESIAVRLYRMNLDGAVRQMVFEYVLPGTEGEMLPEKSPHLSLLYEVNGEEIIVEVYIGEQPHPFYRMNLDGTNKTLLGMVPKL